LRAMIENRVQSFMVLFFGTRCTMNRKAPNSGLVYQAVLPSLSTANVLYSEFQHFVTGKEERASSLFSCLKMPLYTQ